MVTHDGSKIPRLEDSWDSDNIEWVTVVWDEDVACHGTMTPTSSTWVLPANWTSSDENEDVPVTDCEGTTYDHANQILLSTTETEGIFTITNRVTFQDTTQLDRSVKIRVKET